MKSPAQRHYERAVAAKAAATAETGGSLAGASRYELMLAKLTEDRRRLKIIKSVERKIEVKHELLPEYQEWIDGALKAGKGAQDDVLTTVLVWHIDVGDYERALQIAEYAIEHRLTLPDQYSRDIPTMLLDEFSEAYLRGKLAENPETAMGVLYRVVMLTEDRDTPDQARAKLHKAFAYAQLAFVDKADAENIMPTMLPYAQAAMANLQRALELFEGIGVKKDIERLERRLKKAKAG